MPRFGIKTSLLKAAAAGRAYERRKDAERLIGENSGLSAKEEPTYELLSVDFNAKTRAASVLFEETTRYRTIERYVTQNYTRYPVYSDWKSKTKQITKSIRLTNEALEELEGNPDPLLSEFAFDIVAQIDDESLYPSWFNRILVKEDADDQRKNLDSRRKVAEEAHNNRLASIEKEVSENNRLLSINQSNVATAEKRLTYFRNKVEKIDRYHHSVFLDIITFSIHWFLRRPARRNKYVNWITIFEKTRDSSQAEISRLAVRNAECSQSQVQEEVAYQKLTRSFDREGKNIDSEESARYPKIQMLNTEVENTGEWIPLGSISGLNPQKIIGVYLIHNRKNGRFYVGQSKDVMKRLKQHFDGTIPKNQIFAEDYYSTEKSERESLFEVQILPLKTKDELDRTEKEYIETLHANTTGYNKTSGNS